MSETNQANSSQIPQYNFSDPLQGRFFLTPEEKADKEKGKAIIKSIYTTQTSNANNTNLNYFTARNSRWINNLLWAKGSQLTSEFLDYMNVSDANKAWINLDMTPTRIATQFVATLVESMAKTQTYPCVTAIDAGSLYAKEQRLFDALFRMEQVKQIAALQQQSGIQLEPTNAYVPDDEISARVYFEFQDRLPKEIKFEKMLAYIQNSIKFERVLNRKTLYDAIVLNCGVTKIERLAPMEYTVRKCIPTNMVFNFFMNDTGDSEITQIGEFYNLKVKDFRSRFGKTSDRPDGLTEKQIFDLTKLSNTKNIGTFNYMWNENWALTTYNQNRPYDDYSILVFDCEVNFEEDQYAVSKKDNFGKENITIKKNVPYQTKDKNGNVVPQQKPDDVEIITTKKNTWMRGVYVPYGDVMLYWGKPDLIISKYTDVAKPMSSYSINIANNDGEYVPSLFESIMEPRREYQLTKLKRKQLIAKIKPTGIRIDVESARNLDLGNGDTIAWEEVVRIYDQTGNELWSSKGLDPLQREAPPLSNTVRNETIQDIIGLTNILLGIVNEIRGLIGVPSYRDGADVGDRTAAKLAEGQNQASYNRTDYVLNANNQLWEETFYKLCLLYWNDIVKNEPESADDMINTRFDLSIKTKSSDYEKALLEADIQRYSQMPDAQGNPSITPKDANRLRNIQDYKLADLYLTNTWDSNRRKAIEDSQRLQQENQQIQQQSAQQTAQMQSQLQDKEMAAKKEMLEFEYTQKKILSTVDGMWAWAAKNIPLPPQMVPLLQNIIPNLTIPIVSENKEMVQQEQQEQMQQAAHQYAMQQMQNGQQGSPPDANQQPQQDQPQQQPEMQQ